MREGLVSALYGHLYSQPYVAACLMTSRLLSAYDYFYAVEAKKSILAKMTAYYISVKMTFQDFIGHARILLWSKSYCIGLTPDPLMLCVHWSAMPD